MILLGNVVTGIATLCSLLISLYKWAFIVNAILSWVQPNPYNPAVVFLRNITEPALYRIRKFLPFTYSFGMDFSPLVAIIALQLTDSILIQTIYEYGLQLK